MKLLAWTEMNIWTARGLNERCFRSIQIARSKPERLKPDLKAKKRCVIGKVAGIIGC